MIILPGACHMVAKMVAERLQNAIKSHPENIGTAQVALTISSGTVSTDRFPDAGADDLVSMALNALSAAQKLGYNSIFQATPAGT